MKQLETIVSPNVAPAVGKGVVVGKSWQRKILTFLMVAGPGLIEMEADNDAGAVSTYMQAGAQYGLHLMWIMGAAAHHLLRAGDGCPSGNRYGEGPCSHDL